MRSRRSHIDLMDGLETDSPYFNLYSPGLALSLGGSLSCSSSPLSESALICSSFSPRRFICFVPSGSRVAEATEFRFQGTELAALSTPEASLKRLVPLVGHPAAWEPLPSVSHWDLPEQTLVPSLP